MKNEIKLFQEHVKNFAARYPQEEEQKYREIKQFGFDENIFCRSSNNIYKASLKSGVLNRHFQELYEK